MAAYKTIVPLIAAAGVLAVLAYEKPTLLQKTQETISCSRTALATLPFRGAAAVIEPCIKIASDSVDYKHDPSPAIQAEIEKILGFSCRSDAQKEFSLDQEGAIDFCAALFKTQRNK